MDTLVKVEYERVQATIKWLENHEASLLTTDLDIKTLYRIIYDLMLLTPSIKEQYQEFLQILDI